MDQPVEQRSGRTTTRVELAEAVYAAAALPRKEAAAFVDQVLEEIIAALVREGEVKISNFGSFTVRSKSERIGRNPKSAEAVCRFSRRTDPGFSLRSDPPFYVPWVSFKSRHSLSPSGF